MARPRLAIASPGALRQRRRRARRAAERHYVAFEVDPCVTELLIDFSRLSGVAVQDGGDSVAISEAVRRLVDDWSEFVTRYEYDPLALAQQDHDE